jgi:hypothetical protein
MLKYILSLSFLSAALFTQCTNSLSDDEQKSLDRNQNDAPSNSYFCCIATNINYSYVENSQTHDYSGNWDFDGDGILDRIIFVGNGAAHIYFKLLVYLTSIDDFIYFSFIQLDSPLYEPFELLRNSSSEKFPSFSVSDFNDDGINDIFLSVVDEGNLSDKLKHVGVNSTKIILFFNIKKKSFDFIDYSPNN